MITGLEKNNFSFPFGQAALKFCFRLLISIQLADNQVNPLPIGQVRMKSYLPDVNIYSSWTILQHFFQPCWSQLLHGRGVKLSKHQEADGSLGFTLTFAPHFLKLFQEESDTRLSVQEALSMMAPSYRKADATILALIESLILSYVQQVIVFPYYWPTYWPVTTPSGVHTSSQDVIVH